MAQSMVSPTARSPNLHALPRLRSHAPNPTRVHSGTMVSSLSQKLHNRTKLLVLTICMGPCPGLNTLASHGRLPAMASQPHNRLSLRFKKRNALTILVTFRAFLVDGNHLTNLRSIGQKTQTRTNPSAPTIIGGLNTHGVIEGDASTTHGNFYFVDNVSFNETLFQVGTTYGGGEYNLTAVAASIFPYRFFVKGRDTSAALNLTVAPGFFQDNQFPRDIHRRDGTFGLTKIG
ncbi:hypothetical protein FIBSPDRAFT_959156 [Athelia psychrophila]|uniref:Heme haloperoxidase family profile domain-containing protein n=1 Tax=Athelia psychrophila TaxID=1759441 RepID=A0A166DS81_9AGAM|nr:hypothetical protein FIBSPDRAFT_959156 [Fibularhizoctonia sp. CBS 109695]